MKIAICDEIPEQLKDTKAMIKRYFREQQATVTIKAYLNPEELYKCKNAFDIYFITLDIDNLQGIELALFLKKTYRECIIILISNSDKHLQLGYKTKASRFFIKPINWSEFRDDFSDVLTEAYGRDYVFLDGEFYLEKIWVRDIYYLEKFGRKVRVHTEYQSYLSNRKIYEWSEDMKGFNFLCPYKGIIINPNVILKIGTVDVILINNWKIPLSRRKASQFYQSFFKIHDKNRKD